MERALCRMFGRIMAVRRFEKIENLLFNLLLCESGRMHLVLIQLSFQPRLQLSTATNPSTSHAAFVMTSSFSISLSKPLFKKFMAASLVLHSRIPLALAY